MKSNKKESNQKSILNFFNSSSGISGKKRNFKEMDGQANLELNSNSIESSQPNIVKIFVLFNISLGAINKIRRHTSQNIS
jgi:hypothetical protein